jgi:hypothetical protein
MVGFMQTPESIDVIRDDCFERGIIYDYPIERGNPSVIGFNRKRPILSSEPIYDPIPSEEASDTTQLD